MITNVHNLPISVALWLLKDDYDYQPDPNHISVTSLIKPLRAISLSRQMPPAKNIDLMDLVPSRTGTALHTAIEKAWGSQRLLLLGKLGYTDQTIDKMVINPQGEVYEHQIPIYMEKRSSAMFGKYRVSGKFDFVIEDRIEDFKSTSTWSYVFQSSAKDYILQGSMYRYLNQDIIKDDVMNLTYIFTDWSATKAKQDRDYPQTRILCQQYPLMSIQETETWIANKIATIDALEGKDQSELPLCNKEELWQKDAVWKYYKNPANVARSTKNFDNSSEAYARLTSDGSVGKVVEVPGEVKRCTYCNAYEICAQRQYLQSVGALK